MRGGTAVFRMEGYRMAEIRKESFGTLKDGRAAELYTLRNAKGTEVKVTTYGARLVAWKTAAPAAVDVLLGYADAATYEADDDSAMGGIVGRHANRIEGGRAVIDGRTYQLELNTGSHKQNHIHGGFHGFHEKLWTAEPETDALKLTYHSVDGEGGYPGNLDVTVRYALSDADELFIRYEAVSDADTICNLTNHSYFNLDGYASGSILDQKIQIFADQYTWADSESLPDGRIPPVEGTPMDLREPVRIGAHIDDDFDELRMGAGYDHNWVIRDEKPVCEAYAKAGLKKAAYAESDKTGLTLTCYTTQPGIQFYTGNYLNGQFRGKGGATYPRRSGFALETQFFPNALAHPNFPQPILKKGETWKAETVYVLGTKG